jgi:hypothetical protein
MDYEDIAYEDSVSSDTGWPGDGSGEDDFQDYNQNEADDYRDEGREDDWLESDYEDRTEIGYDY